MPSKGKINHAPNVHAALAAAMSDPGLLESWLHDPLALRDVRIDEKDDRHLDGLMRLQNLLGEAETLDLVEVRACRIRRNVEAGLARHRLVYATLGDLMGGAIHALGLKTLTPEEAAGRR